MAKFHVLCTVLMWLVEQGALSDHNEDTWEHDPLAFNQEHALSFSAMHLDYDSICPKCDGDIPEESADMDNAMALIYYKKFIANLFQRKKLQYDENLAVYQRALIFTIQPTQLEKLEQLKDPRDLDIVLSEIFAGIRTPYRFDGQAVDYGEGPGVFALVWDILKDFAQLLKTSEVQFALMVIVAILGGWLVSRRYRIGVITMILCGFVIFGYFFTYLECNRRLEVEQMLQVLAKEEQRTLSNDKAWYKSFMTWFRPDAIVTQHEALKKASKLNFPYCRPDHVLMLYGNELFLKQLEFLLDKCMATIYTFQNNLSFPYSLIAPPLLIVLIAYMVKLIFKYILSPRAWIALMHRPRHYLHPQNASLSGTPTEVIQEDRISGENLKLLLTAISSAPPSNGAASQIGSNNGMAASGVQEIQEQLEADPVLSNSNSSSSNSSKHDLSYDNNIASPINRNEAHDIIEQDSPTKALNLQRVSFEID